MNKDIEYYEFTYKIPKYKIKPPLNFCKYYQIHKDEIIIDLQQENKQLKEDKKEAVKYINRTQMPEGYKKELLEILGDKE